jgi:hypothetical protein
MRPFGFSSLLFLDCERGGTDKLVYVEVGKMSYEDITNTAATLFHVGSAELRIVRIDLATDVVGYSVEWFRRRASVSRKRSGREIGTLYGDTMERGVETLTFGRRPNMFRIYDKLAQLCLRAKKICGLEPTLLNSTEAGNPHVPLTRVERQYGGGKIPSELATLASLRDRALTINPFEPLEFLAGPTPIPVSADLGGSQYLKLIGLRRLIELNGYQATVSELNQRTGGKGKRLIRHIQGLDDDEPNEPPDLLSLYRESLACQLDPHCYRGVGNTPPATRSMDAESDDGS